MEIPSRSDIRLERIVDRFDPRVLRFCREVCEENGADADFYDQSDSFNYTQTTQRFSNLGESESEEIWKFGKRKWRETNFENLECLVWGERVIGLSGCRAYEGGLLRVSMHLYTLKSFRKTCRNFQFAPDGLFSRHLDFARAHGDFQSLFMSVYPHSKRLLSHAKNLGGRHLTPGRTPSPFISDLKPWHEPVIFHNVPQYFFFYPLRADFNFDGRAPQCKTTS